MQVLTRLVEKHERIRDIGVLVASHELEWSTSKHTNNEKRQLSEKICHLLLMFKNLKVLRCSDILKEREVGRLLSILERDLQRIDQFPSYMFDAKVCKLTFQHFHSIYQ